MQASETRMDRLVMKTKDIRRENLEKLRALFPNAVTEVMKGEETVLAVDFDVLREELSETVDGKQERYQMSWPEKSKARRLASSRVTATLRPVRERSRDFDHTENVYIEGDNLDALKLLREPYLGKIKMIYIDPPYNTGSDFVYEDDYSLEGEHYKRHGSGQFDEAGMRLVKNYDSNGRFHTDWLNMIYPRLKVARDLLSDDGVIFISIGDGELARLIEICDELFFARNRMPIFSRITKKSSNNGDNFSPCVDYVVIYAKDIGCVKEFSVEMDEDIRSRYNKTDEHADERGPYQEVGLYQAALKHGGSSYPILCPDGERVLPPDGKPWRWNEATFLKGKEEGRIVFKRTKTTPLIRKDGTPGSWNVYTKVYLNEREERGMHPKNFSDAFQNTLASAELAALKIPFDFAKPVALVKYFAKLLTGRDDTILDFFSGSATTAHAVMQLNAEDGGRRKFIMIQIPEACDEKSEAYRAGFRTICDIGEERIRRAGERTDCSAAPDVGFRVFRLDSSNMRDVYYAPEAQLQERLDDAIDNIKPDRTAWDLLFQVMLELGVELSAKIEKKSEDGKTYFAVNRNELIACFDEDITNDVITAIAAQKPLYAAFRDGTFGDSVGINNEQLFGVYSPGTKIRIL